jgi:uncharacterized protein YqhQ
MVRSVSSQKPLVNSDRSNQSSMHQRSLILFHSAIKSDRTKHQYDYHLKQFKEYFIIKSYDDLAQITPKKIQIQVRFHIRQNRFKCYSNILRIQSLEH